MEFKERLLQTRRSMGMSQEELAERVGVSRQAVSKWETGEAQPDFSKLCALADALGVTLDYLCGRAECDEVTPPRVPQPKKRSVLLIVLAALVGFFALLSLLLVLLNFRSNSKTEETWPEEVLPSVVTVSNAKFTYQDGKVTYSFVPSVVGGNITYRVCFADPSGKESHSFEAVYENGLCSGTEVLPAGADYTVSVLVFLGDEQRLVAVASGLQVFGDDASWSPAEPGISSNCPDPSVHHSEEHDDHNEHSGAQQTGASSTTASTAAPTSISYPDPASTHHPDDHDNHH